MDQGKPPPVAMLEMGMGMWLSQALAAVATLGVADQLNAGPRPVSDLARATGADEGAMYRVLRTLASRGVFAESPPRTFALTPMGDLLREDAPGTLRQAIIMFNRPWNARSWEQCLYSLKTAKPALDHVFGTDSWQYFAKNPDDQQNFDRAMTNLSASMHAAAVEAYDFSGISSICDIGGGHGRLLSLVLKKYPKMKGEVYDQPHVVAGAMPLLKAAGLEGRAKVTGGDFFESIPAGHDAYVMSHILHDWSDDRCINILKNCRKGAKAGGRLLVLDAVIKPGNEPDLGKLIDLEMLVCVSGRERTQEEFAGLMKAAGYAFRRVVPTKSSVSVVEGVAE